jgi:hypothetical protein
MELHKFHVHQRRTGMVGERMTISRIFPTVAGNLVRPSNSSRRQYHSLGAEHVKSTTLAIISKRARDAPTVLQKRDDCVFHENVETKMNSMVLKSADHLQAGTVAHMREPRIPMAAEIPLQNPAVAGAIKKRSPGLQFTHARGSFLGMQLRHPPVIQVLTAAHGVGKVNPPAVPVVHISHRRSYATLGHDGVCFAKERFRNNGDLYTGSRDLDGSPQTRAPGSNNQNVVLMRDVLAH